MEVCRECFANIHDLSNPTVEQQGKKTEFAFIVHKGGLFNRYGAKNKACVYKLRF